MIAVFLDCFCETQDLTDEVLATLYSNAGDAINAKGSLMEYHMEYYKSMRHHKTPSLRICLGPNGILGADSRGSLTPEADK